MPRDPKLEPLESNYRELNQAFYRERPWDYFLQRLVHLAAIASDTGKLPFDGPISIGPVTIESHAPTVTENPSPGQTFVAVESEILLHHAAETLLRFIYAHAEPSPCPWIRMSSLRNFSDFKDWVSALRDDSNLDDLVGRLFGRSDEYPDAPAKEAEWVRVFAQHFLDSSSYNAAKHGMALAGGAARGTITVEEKEILRAQGSVVSWLAKWPELTAARPRRWTRITRIFSTEAYIVMVKVAADLIQSIWIQARMLHLEESTDDLGYVPLGSPQSLFERLGLPRHILYETYAPLAYDGEPTEVIVQFPAFPGVAGDDGTDRSSPGGT
jgi:hypothetical protein